MQNVIYPLSIIKSKIILKYIFNHLRNNKKLIIMCYNKFLQNKLEFTIDDYKKMQKELKLVD